MEKRVLITIGISIAIIVVWFKLFPPAPPPPQQPAPPPPAATTAAPAAGTPAAAGAAAAPGAATAPGGERAAEKRNTVERPGLWRAVFTTWGAGPVEFTLLHPQYKEYVWVPKPDYLGTLAAGTPPVRTGDDDPNWRKELVPINLVRKGAAVLPYTVTFPESSFALAPDAAWTLVSESAEELVYAVEVGPPPGTVRVEKRWRLPRDGYQLGLQVTVENKGDKPITEHLQMTLAGWQDPLVKPGGMFGARQAVAEPACHANNKYQHESLESLLKERKVHVGDVKWAAINEQFFITAAAFQPEPGQERRCTLVGEPSGRVTSEAYFAARTVAPGQKAEHPMAAYLGPKTLYLLDDVQFGGVDAKLGDAVDYGIWEIIARPMLWTLRQIQRVVVNWGVAIILITLLLKALTYYPTLRSMKSMRAMAALKPKMDAIREKFKDDKNRQNQEVMNLYKTHGINPLGGCLPTLIQMPIYIAFYSMLSSAVELYRARFIGPIDDMTAPFWPLAAVTGALMFLQQKITPQAADSQQQKMMMYLMPAMFMVFTLFLPSGLTLYILTNTVLTMVQQWWFNRTHPLPNQPAPPSGTKAAKPAKA